MIQKMIAGWLLVAALLAGCAAPPDDDRVATRGPAPGSIVVHGNGTAGVLFGGTR